MSEQYIKDTAEWAQHFNLAAYEMEEFLFEDVRGEQGILAFRVRFASGHAVTALSSRPTNLRSKGKKTDRVRIDEAAFHDNLKELLKAAIAIKMWGGKVAIWSTHNGVDNPFNALVEEIRKGEKPFSLHRVTLADALEDGLYERICYVNDTPWTMEGELAWVTQLYQEYGVVASEELDCVPFKAEAGKLFNRNWFEVVDRLPSTPNRYVRFWDFAATAKDLAKKQSCFTAAEKWCKIDKTFYICDAYWEQVGGDNGDDSVKAQAQQDGKATVVRWELEGGSAAIRYEAKLKASLQGFNAKGVKPLGDKVTRAIPWANEAKAGNIKLVRGDWNDQFLDAVHSFDGTPKPLVNDLVDSGSGAYAELQTGTSAFDYY